MKRFLMVPVMVVLVFLGLSSASAALAQEATQIPEARIVVTKLSVDPQDAAPGQDVTVTAEVRNIGDVQGSQARELFLDGALVQSVHVTLDPGQSQTLAFTRLGGSEGNHMVAVCMAPAFFSFWCVPWA